VPKRINILTRADFSGKKDAETEFAKLLDAIHGKRRLPDPKSKSQEPAEMSSRDENPNHVQVNASIPRPPEVGFVARRDRKGADIVAQLKGELAPHKNQLVALWGDGGVGKTTIAAEVVREVAKVVAIHVLWIRMDGRHDFTLSTLLDEIATQLGNPEIRKLAIEPKKEAIRELIRESKMPALVVLDNFETISPAEQKQCVEWVNNQAPCPALITTRTRVDGVRNIPVKAMLESEANEFLDRMIEQVYDPDAFERLDRNHIIEAAGANPLVMQWIIAQIDQAQLPSDVLKDLARGEGDAAERIFDRSFNLPQVGSDGRDTLLALSLFAPSASPNALAAVAGFGKDSRRVREAIRSLGVLSLVKTTREERWIIEGLTRDLAKARLMKDERADDFSSRFVTYFLQYAQLYSKTTKEHLDALELEKDNVLSAMDVAFAIQDWESVMQIMYGIGHMPDGFLSLRGHWDEAIRMGAQASEAALKIKDEKREAVFIGNAAIIRQNRGEYEQADILLQQAIEIFKRIESKSNIAAALHQLGMIAQAQGDIDKAQRLYNESLEIEKELGNQGGIASTFHELGRLAQSQGEIEKAQHFYSESLEINKKLDDQSGIAQTLHQLGMLAQSQGRIGKAYQLYNESLEIEKRLGNQNGIAQTLHQLGMVAQEQGKTDEAHLLYKDSLKISKRLGDQNGIALTIWRLGLFEEGENNYEEAARLLREALSIFEKLKSPDAEGARESLERVEGKLK
ncbi:MAG TPA: tetratricopeptide repeat protein, partial [Blastocatellia bacterium]|nr:tetratricopeptide repeat protein [Blastocatellia bacterium]